MALSVPTPASFAGSLGPVLYNSAGYAGSGRQAATGCIIWSFLGAERGADIAFIGLFHGVGGAHLATILAQFLRAAVPAPFAHGAGLPGEAVAPCALSRRCCA